MFKKNKNILLLLLMLAFITGISCEISSIKELRKAEREYGLGNKEAYDKILQVFIVNEDFSKEAALALGRIGRKDAVPYLVEALNDNLKTAPEALRALSMLKDTRCIPVLIRIVREKRPYAPKAIKLMGELKDKRVLPVLMEIVEKESRNYIYAIDALGKIGDQRAIPILMKNLRYQKPKEEPDIQFKIVTRGEKTPGLEKREKILSLSQPSIRIEDVSVDASKRVMLDFSAYDFDLDTLNILAQYSTSMGNTWKPATINGKLTNLSVDDYKGTFVWLAYKDIPNYNLSTVLLKFKPTDFGTDFTRGVPDYVHITVDTTNIKLGDISGEFSGDLDLKLYTPKTPGVELNQLYYHYTFDEGKTWFPANAREGVYNNDTLMIKWSTALDMDRLDMDNVIFRVSSSGRSVIGREDRTKHLHIDNNHVPTAQIRAIRIIEEDVIKFDYLLEDREKDRIDLEVEYSRNGGVSWFRATVDENLHQLDENHYKGTITWNSQFDIPIPGNDKIRLRIMPKDNDFGIPGTTEDFSLSKIQLAKVQPTDNRGELTVQYNSPTTEEDEQLFFDGYYSLDNGKTWRLARADRSMTPERNKGTRYNMDWSIDQDVLDYQDRIGSVMQALMEMKTKEMIPDLILLALKRTSPLRSDRVKAVEALRLLQAKPDWVLDGLLEALINPEEIIHTQAVKYLQNVDIPRVKMALADYHSYWDQFARNDREIYSQDKEWEYQKILETQSKFRKPSSGDMEEFMIWKGMKPEKAKMFLSNLDNMRALLKLREDYEEKKISYEEYKRRYAKIIDERK